ncbi:hypothetical protein GYMLUDRAFT_615305 [Collybiopsis luxurians FD-317 M1]|uniref:Uncharacterized protein n=1 Tax=Collybiopsis luxurians FD-317 M1 TaxID=944289 RepID=A0A0D0CVY9_9AGAR|nr:hypothetical protein GYMLUDRAFT_615305 [Collybiopsis luxurians FD-317 M1]
MDRGCPKDVPSALLFLFFGSLANVLNFYSSCVSYFPCLIGVHSRTPLPAFRISFFSNIYLASLNDFGCSGCSFSRTVMTELGEMSDSTEDGCARLDLRHKN